MSIPIDQNQILHYQRKLQYEIDAADLFEALQNGQELVIIDARLPEVFANEHIPGAVNFPHRTINAVTAGMLLDKEIECITYCDGIGCNASTKAALRLSELGFRVRELIGGLDWWKLDGYPIKTVKSEQHCHSNCGCG